MEITNKISTCLWFDKVAEEAVEFYTSVFKHSKVKRTIRFSREGQEIHGQEAGTIMSIDFDLEGSSFLALNGGPDFKFNPAISLFVTLSTEKEVNDLYARLAAGGQDMMPLDKYEWSDRYAWFSDKFGLSWQLMLNAEADKTKIDPLLFFTQEQRGNAEEAIEFYTSIFRNSKIGPVSKYPESAGDPAGMVMHALFTLENVEMRAMDAGRDGPFPFTEAVSLIVNCEDQDEIDYYWEKLTQDGDPKFQQCGWLKDKFGVSWQVVPKQLDDFLEDEKSDKAKRTMRSLLQMKKIDLAEIEEAYNGR